MKIDPRKSVTIKEATQDFSRVAGIADSLGEVYIFENGKPKYILIDLEQDTLIEMSDDEKIDFVATRVLREYRRTFEELAK